MYLYHKNHNVILNQYWSYAPKIFQKCDQVIIFYVLVACIDFINLLKINTFVGLHKIYTQLTWI